MAHAVQVQGTNSKVSINFTKKSYISLHSKKDLYYSMHRAWASKKNGHANCVNKSLSSFSFVVLGDAVVADACNDGLNHAFIQPSQPGVMYHHTVPDLY